MIITKVLRLLCYIPSELGTDFIAENDRYWYSYCWTDHFSQGGYYHMKDYYCPDNWEIYS